MKKKMKKYEGGGDVYTGDDEIVKYRMGIKDKPKEEAKTETASRDFDSTDSETPSMNLPAKQETTVPKKTAAKLTPKAEAPTPKVEPKAETKSYEEKTGFEAKKAKALEGTDVKTEAPKERSLPRGQAKATEGVSSFIEKSKAQIGQAARDQEASYKATQAKMKESGSNMSPRMKAARASEKSANMKSGGKVKSASARADGCAIRGKTRA
jgi:hypothetical protein